MRNACRRRSVSQCQVKRAAAPAGGDPTKARDGRNTFHQAGHHVLRKQDTDRYASSACRKHTF